MQNKWGAWHMQQEEHSLLSWQCARLPFCLFGAAVFCERRAYSSSLKRPEDKSERAPLRREAGQKNRGRWLRSRRKGEDERQEITAAKAWNPGWLVKEDRGPFVQVRTITLIPRLFTEDLFKEERSGGLKSAVINHKGGQMRCIIQSFPGCCLKPLKALAGGSVLKTNAFMHSCGLWHEMKNCCFWRMHYFFYCLDSVFVSQHKRCQGF